MFVTMVEGGVDDAREGDLRSAWDERTSGDLPTGLVESYLMHADDGVWRIVTIWESKEAVMAMRATVEKPTAMSRNPPPDTRGHMDRIERELG
jgi:hypothetical protein